MPLKHQRSLSAGIGKCRLARVVRQLKQIAVMQVIYGDTDSIMVNTKSTELEQVGVGYSCITCSEASSHFAVLEV